MLLKTGIVFALSRRIMSRCKLTVFAIAILAASIRLATRGRASDHDEVCDATADYFLGAEDYPQAVESHLRVIAAHPDDALAHYHLGFAYGMLGSHRDELTEYLRAVGLGLKQRRNST